MFFDIDIGGILLGVFDGKVTDGLLYKISETGLGPAITDGPITVTESFPFQCVFTENRELDRATGNECAYLDMTFLADSCMAAPNEGDTVRIRGLDYTVLKATRDTAEATYKITASR
jgi:hypothetical protein